MPAAGHSARFRLALLLALLAVVMEPAGAGSEGGQLQPARGRRAAGAECAGAAPLLRGVRTAAGRMLADVFNFWLEHGLDAKYGGFYGTLERGGAVGRPSSKGIVQQARHAWAFSHAAATGALARGRAEPAARAAWDFMTQHMHRPEKPGTWRWLVARDGSRSVNNDTTSLYGQWFSIYAATQFYKAFNDRAALDLALATFRATDALFHDAATGGYDETDSLPRLADTSLPGGGVPRSLNIFLHGTEALAAMYGATGDAAVLQRLLELVRLVAARLVTADDVIYELYDPATWKPVGVPAVNWGHNLESAWLISETVDVLRARGAITQAEADSLASRVIAVAARALREGYDARNGGVYEAGVPGLPPGQGEGASTEKVWWIQCESMLAMWEVYRRTGDCGALEKLKGTLDFVQAKLRDPLDGEWLWSTDATGARPGYRGYQKGNAWKATYHNTRALMLLREWIEAAGLARP